MAGSNYKSLFDERPKTAVSLDEKMLIRGGEFKTAKTKANAGQLMRLLIRQEYRCALSGRLLTPEVAVIDHVVPVSQGGTNALTNLQWLHKDVNRAKGTLTQAAFLEVCRQVTAYQS